MERSERKPFVLVGNYIISKNDGDKHFINSDQLLELYGLTEEECYLADSRDPVSYLTTGKAIRLYPRYEGDYEEHLQKVLQENWDRTGGIEIKRARKKTKFKTDIPWAKALRKHGKL